MYRLLSGLHAHLTRKEEFNVIILGLDHAGKTTVLEKVKTIFTPSQPGLNPSQITPTIGQNLGRITLSSTYLKFWDLGGSKDIRRIWEKYYDEADAICWVIDSQDRFRNGWRSDSSGRVSTSSQQPTSGGSGTDSKGKGKAKASNEPPSGSERGEGWIELEKVLQHPSIAHSNIPVLVIANKQDREPRPPPPQTGRTSAAYDPPLESDTAPDLDLEDQLLQSQDPMTVEEIKELFNRLVSESERSEKARSLGLSEAHVLGVSALNGQGIREAINWLFLRVATKGQSRKTRQIKNQQNLLKQQQQQQQQSNPYIQLSSSTNPNNNHNVELRRSLSSSYLSQSYRDRPPSNSNSGKNNYIKLVDMNKFNNNNLSSNPST
ncbi:hypothetical protein PSTT_13577 [Puccinia striiformis]|uniref:Uncharacterized protein n=1 Tax=Puccinia striiformis TaxID=27350 RepID=A0A2S4URI5_9BASI|nr:hypothetical protein PSTT_13577 [Puccinia striiformis]